MDKERIKQAVAKLHAQLWYERKELWPNGTPHPIDMLDLDMVAKLLGLRLEYHDHLGELTHRASKVELAGVLDRQARRVAVSTKFPIAEQRFTIAHEFAHYVMHKDLVIHRDRPIRGMRGEGSRRAWREQEADYFAGCLLVPENLLRRTFMSTFGVDLPIIFDENVAFHLSNSSHELLIQTQQGLRARSRAIASAKRFDRRHFYSLSEQFQVSDEAMAIRLEQLALVL